MSQNHHRLPYVNSVVVVLLLLVQLQEATHTILAADHVPYHAAEVRTMQTALVEVEVAKDKVTIKVKVKGKVKVKAKGNGKVTIKGKGKG